MPSHRVTLIPGDGSGPELVAAAVPVLDAATALVGSAIDWDRQLAGQSAMDRLGTPLPPRTIESVKTTAVALKGPLTTPIGTGFRSVNLALRRELDLYACLRPCRLMPGITSRGLTNEIVIVRENTEDLYGGAELEGGTADAVGVLTRLRDAGHAVDQDAGITLKVISPRASARIVRFACDYARRTGRRRVTCVTREDVLPRTDGLFAATFDAVAAPTPGIETEHRLLDDVCREVIADPRRFEVLVMPNLYGDVLSDLVAGLIGGLGVAPSANLGDRFAVFEATHGSAPEFAGTGTLNPTALILAGAMLLRHLGETQAARAVEDAVAEVVRVGDVITADLLSNQDGRVATSTNDFAAEVVRTMRRAHDG